jgi:hypothetical protein
LPVIFGGTTYVIEEIVEGFIEGFIRGRVYPLNGNSFRYFVNGASERKAHNFKMRLDGLLGEPVKLVFAGDRIGYDIQSDNDNRCGRIGLPDCG